MSPPAASLALHPVPAPCDRDRSAASILLSMSNEEPPHQDIDISDEQHNSSDGANASRKGQPWTEEEHMAFLQGLRKLGKGNWRQISRSFVPSRTPTQVASHAQKHFMRVAGATKRKSRFTALEVEVVTGPAVQSSLSEQAAQGSHPCQEQPVSLVLQPTAIPSLAPAFPAVPFPFMPPMMFGFPGPFFPPFVCPPPAPAFAAAVLSAIQKQGHMPTMMPPVFPLAAMAAMNPFFMAHQMAAAAQAAAANAANVNAGREAASGGATTAGTAATATTDTATSADVGRQPRSAPGSPPVCKQEAQSVRPSAQVASGTASPLPGRPAPGTGTAVDGATGLTYRERKDAVPVAEATGIKQEEGLLSFQTSS